MLDLNSLMKIETITAKLYDNGEVISRNQAGFKVDSLSGNWKIIPKLASLINKEERSKFITETFNQTYTPSIYFFIVITDNSGKELLSYPLSENKLKVISKFIKIK